MEDGLRQHSTDSSMWRLVLILVVMEDGLRHNGKETDGMTNVLILVVMEDGLRQKIKEFLNKQSLNPCCNGRWSQTHLENCANYIWRKS